MRLWTLHPCYLDRQGLVALWREALLAQKVLQGQTTGYRHHPQLVRFRAMPEPVALLATYLVVVYEEATRRGYRFAASKIAPERSTATLTATDGQLRYEWRHLRHKLLVRDPARAACYASVVVPVPHPLFRLVPGPVSAWERVVEGAGAGPGRP
jgi:hypothetical protein